MGRLGRIEQVGLMKWMVLIGWGGGDGLDDDIFVSEMVFLVQNQHILAKYWPLRITAFYQIFRILFIQMGKSNYEYPFIQMFPNEYNPNDCCKHAKDLHNYHNEIVHEKKQRLTYFRATYNSNVDGDGNVSDDDDDDDA